MGWWDTRAPSWRLWKGTHTAEVSLHKVLLKRLWGGRGGRGFSLRPGHEVGLPPLWDPWTGGQTHTFESRFVPPLAV